MLKKFNYNTDIQSLVSDVMSTKRRTRLRNKNLKVWDRLEEYYSVFKTSQIKNLLIKKIKENILF